MTDNDPFRHAGRATCENTVDRIQVYYLRADTFQQAGVFVKRNDIRIFQTETFKSDFVQHGGIGVRDRHCCRGIQYFRNEFHTQVRHPAVDRYIEVAALDHTHEADKTFNPPVHKDKDRFPQHPSGPS